MSPSPPLLSPSHPLLSPHVPHFSPPVTPLSPPGPLDQPELQPLPPLRSGRAYNVSCVVPNVSPIRNLSLSLFRGDIAVHSATFQDYQHYHPTNASLTFALTARRKDRGQSVACRAVLDMRPYGPLLTANSTAHVLDVYGERPPSCPHGHPHIPMVILRSPLSP